ncbi:hypothetical protein DFQ26_006819 [Actinomortierella ambigua]|nr:hypothetical protein DFQ26_006819 [Actinomortierella ambigua]
MSHHEGGNGLPKGSSGLWASHDGDNGNGRSRGGQIPDKSKSEISAKRPSTAQIGSESTDDLLPAPTLSEDQQYLARWILTKDDFTGFRTQAQTRNFIHSLLVNLSNHHSVDMSGLLLDLASELGRRRLREILQHKMFINAGTHKDYYSFQYIVLPLIGVLTRENVCQSALVQETGLIYAEVYRSRSEFIDQGILPCMKALVDKGSMNDTSTMGRQLRENPSLLQAPSLQHAMLAVIRLIYQLIKRIQGAKTEMVDTIGAVEWLVSECIKQADGSETASFLKENLESECRRLRSMISIPAPSNSVSAEIDASQGGTHEANMIYLKMHYDPPGSLSADGSRHNNDHEFIKDISVIPTQDELTCSRAPFLPSNDVPGAPHHLPPGWPRLLDTHFRLNREDMIDQLRRGVTVFLEAWRNIGPDRRGSSLSRKELRQILGQDVAVYAYDNVEFLGTNTLRHLQGSIKIAFDQPSMLKNQSRSQREDFWQRSKRRLMKGSLVSFIFPADDDDGDASPFPFKEKKYQMCLGIISARDDREMAKNDERAVINVSLTSATDFYRFVKAAKLSSTPGQECLMVQSMNSFFEAYRPVLQSLQTSEPGEMPFGKYLAPTDDQKTDDAVTVVDPPMYARAPGFEFDLSVLLNPPATFHLDVLDPESCQQAVTALRTHSNLDDTQSQALVDALRREVALISGPPGTGKTKIGVDLMRVLLHNADQMKCGPILCICVTNHALDQFLEHLLDQGVNNVVRIGSRSQSKPLHQLGLNELMKVFLKPVAVRVKLAKAYKEWDRASHQLQEVEKELRRHEPPPVELLKFVMMENDLHYSQLQSGDGDGESDENDATIEQNYERWSSSIDLAQMEKENRRKQKKMNKINKKAAQLRLEVLKQAAEMELDDWAIENALADLDDVPSDSPDLHEIPDTDRPLDDLHDADIWTMSKQERDRLRGFWIAETQGAIQSRHAALLDIIQRLSNVVNSAHDEIRRNILRKAQVIGMTTNGAAKFHSIIAALSPRIIVCEEAGEVLESHILAALSGSTQHLILIGDHLQLRPQIATYELSSDSNQGRQYNLDRSLFERLVTTGRVPSSLLTTQRRMRPEICNLVRHTLYPSLQDGERVLDYPNVFGMATNLFFMDHRHPEDSRDQYGIQSYANTFEAEMVKGLVQHLFKNGYEQSNIAVLTPYLGQLSRLRDKLKNLFQVVLDERDQEQLDSMMDDNLESVPAPKANNANNRSLTIRTIDNYQGEEADIIIISLVRSDTREDQRGSLSTIGFLKSPNRTNVLLSRARHGMYLIGNARLMDQSKNGLWPNIVAEMEQTSRVGDGFPLRCRNHPETEFLACMPDDFETHAPGGGCTLPCDQVLSCDHRCKKMCHSDDINHQKYKCDEPCLRMHADCNHMCRKLCGQECGDCTEPMQELELACGHILAKAYCFHVKDPSKARCKEKIVRQLGHCEHVQTIECFKDVNTLKCAKACSTVLACGHACKRQCHECQSESLTIAGQQTTPSPDELVERTVHGSCKEKCGRQLRCGHICKADCHFGSECLPCKRLCLFTCPHEACRHGCESLCSVVCCEPCTWSCPHQGACAKPCGVPCTRLPCNLRCGKTLSCGHQCPSVCGETCPPQKFCVECKSDPRIMEMVVDLKSRVLLGEVDVSLDPLVVLSCGHAQTITSLDCHLKMDDYYQHREGSGVNLGATRFVSVKPLPSLEVPVSRCPVCASPIFEVQRYGRRIKHSHLFSSLRKHEMKQNKKLMEADAKFVEARDNMAKDLRTFLIKLSKPQEPSPTATAPSEKKKTTTKKKRTHGLGRFDDEGDLLPNSDVASLFVSYDIPPEQEKAWTEFIATALKVLKRYDEIRERTARSPALPLYKALVAKVRESKTVVSSKTSTDENVDVQNSEDTVTKEQPESDQDTAATSTATAETQRLIDDCARECFLSPDGQTGSSYVRAIQGRSNVLQLILHAALHAMDKTGGNPTTTGWYWFIDDLLECCLAHVEVLRKAAILGVYPKLKLCAETSAMFLRSMRLMWIGRQPFLDNEGSGGTSNDNHNDNDNSSSSNNKNNNGHLYLNRHILIQEQVMRPCAALLQSIQDTAFPEEQTGNENVRQACLNKARAIEEQLETAVNVAMGIDDTIILPPEKFDLVRILSREMLPSDLWYCCTNEHP